MANETKDVVIDLSQLSDDDLPPTQPLADSGVMDEDRDPLPDESKDMKDEDVSGDSDDDNEAEEFAGGAFR